MSQIAVDGGGGFSDIMRRAFESVSKDATKLGSVIEKMLTQISLLFALACWLDGNRVSASRC